MITDAQKAALKAHIAANADPYVVSQRELSAAGVAEWYSRPTVAFYVWRTSVTALELFEAISWAGDGGLISRSMQEVMAFNTLVSAGRINPSVQGIRKAINDIFSGQGAAAVDSRAAVLALSKRLALNIEAVFAVGTGTLANPATLRWEGAIGYQDVQEAINS